MDNAYVISRLRTGDMMIFTEVFNTHYRPLCNYAYSILHQDEDAKDAVQDIFTKLCTSPELWGKIIDVRGYLYQSVRNRCLAIIRSSKGGMVKSDVEVGSALANIGAIPDAYLADEENDLQFKIHHLLSKLPNKRRRVVEMYYAENITYKELAARLGLTKDTIKTQLALARGSFQAMKHLLRLLIGISVILYIAA